ncbi:hypothetical protein ES703_72821 [subsurface metagenome]
MSKLWFWGGLLSPNPEGIRLSKMWRYLER